jgi:hypothetical protein
VGQRRKTAALYSYSPFSVLMTAGLARLAANHLEGVQVLSEVTVTILLFIFLVSVFFKQLAALRTLAIGPQLHSTV